MVDDQGEDPAAARPRPAIGEEAEGHAVGAAGDGDGERRAVLERSQRRHGRGELAVRQRRVERRSAAPYPHAQEQPARRPSCAAFSFTAAGAWGKARESSLKVAQASFFLPIDDSDMPSLSKVSGAFGPVLLA